MIELVIGFIGIAFLCFMKQASAKSVAREYFYGFMGLFFIAAMLGGLYVYYGSYALFNPTPSVFPLTVTTNTVYLNANAAPLYISAITSGQVVGWVGNSIRPNTMVINAYESLSGVGVSLSYNASATAVVPAGFYYKFNYTGSTSFVGTITGT